MIEKSADNLGPLLAIAFFVPLKMYDTSFYLSGESKPACRCLFPQGDGIQLLPTRLGVVRAYINGQRKLFRRCRNTLDGRLCTIFYYAAKCGTLEGKRILGRKSVELMIVDHIPKIGYGSGQGFGLGFAIVKDLGERGIHGSVGEYSWGGAYHSTYWVDPKEDLVVVYMTQLIPAGAIDDFGKLRSLVYQSIIE